MLGGVTREERPLEPVVTVHSDAERRVRELERRVASLQAEVASLRARQLRSGEQDSGVGCMSTEREVMHAEVERLANIGSWSWDVRTNAVAWSEQAYRIFGYEPGVDAATNEAFFAALHPDDRKVLLEAAPRTALTGITSPPPRCRFIHRDGSVRHAILTGSPIRDASGELVRIVGAALDITGFVEVESELRRTAQLLNDAERMAGLGSWSWCAESQRIHWSETMYRIFGIEPGVEITSDLFYERVHPDDREHLRNSSHCLAGGRALTSEFRVSWPDGSVRHVTMESHAERDEHGRPLRLMGTVQDITARAQLEHQLRHSQKMDALGTFAGGIAHDVNNYLMVIQGNAQLLRARSTPGSFESRRVEEIGTAASSCAALTRQLLSFARRQASAPRLVDTGELIANRAQLLRRVLGDEVELVVSTGGRPAVSRIDPAQLEQVLVNLAVNARDAMPVGGVVRIDVVSCLVDVEFASSRPALSPGSYVRISVRDTGTGIPAAVRARVFEPFFTTKAQGKGTGLGLSTVYGILKQWRGHIELESQVGEGTVFHVWLPAHPGPADSVRESEPARPAPGCETVLLAEDEPQVRFLIQTVLEQAGYTVVLAEDGRHALELAERLGHVDLLVSDVRMPHLGGVELARRLRSLWPRLEVILMSGYPEVDSADTHDPGVGHSLLAKPFGTTDLLGCVRKALDRMSESA
jgi:PAS domain S-box-containing protein